MSFTDNSLLEISILIISPSSIIPIGPFSAASGETCPIAAPLVAPEKRPSVRRATSLSNPIPQRAEVGASISRIPGPPFGPSYRMTTTSPFLISPSIIAWYASSSELNTLAGPSKAYIFLLTADTLTTPPSGARLPYNTAIPLSLLCGLSYFFITSLFFILADATF